VILKVSYATTPTLTTNGVGDGSKTLAIETTDTVEVVKQKLTEKLVKGLAPVVVNTITSEIRVMNAKFHPSASNTTVIKLFDDTVIGELPITSSSVISLFPATHGISPEDVSGPLEVRGRSPSSATRSVSPGPQAEPRREKKHKDGDEKKPPKEKEKEKDREKRARVRSVLKSPPSQTLSPEPRADPQVEILSQRIAQLVSICDSLYQDLVNTKIWNLKLQRRIATLEQAQSIEPPSNQVDVSPDSIENVELRRRLAGLRRETRDEGDIDEPALVKELEEQPTLAARLQMITNTLIAEVDESDTPSTLFRGRSISTILISKFLQLYGQDYLNNVIVPSISKVVNVNSALCCEVNPRLLESATNKNITDNQENLKAAFFLVFSAISGNPVPAEFSALFQIVSQQVSTRFPDTTMHLRAVGGFFFLRFFCPFLVNFRCVGDGRKALLYVSKILQNLANNQPFDKKESYMMEFNSIISATEPEMTRFLNQISVSNMRIRSLSQFTVNKRAFFTRDDSEVGLRSHMSADEEALTPRSRLMRSGQTKKNTSMIDLNPAAESAPPSEHLPAAASSSSSPNSSPTTSSNSLPLPATSPGVTSSHTSPPPGFFSVCTPSEPPSQSDTAGTVPADFSLRPNIGLTRMTGKLGKKYDISVSMNPDS
jgi:hypothetical protein